MLFRSGMKLLRYGLCVGCFLTLVAWVMRGGHLCDRIEGSPESLADREVRKITDRLAAENPQAAEELARLKEARDVRAVAATLRDAETRQGLSGVSSLVERYQRTQQVPYEIRLSSLAADPRRLTSLDEREAFLWAHGSAMQVLATTLDATALDDYLQRVERASRDPETWRLAKSDALAMLVWEQVTEADLRRYYEEERDWLAEVLVQLAAMVEGDAADQGRIVADGLRVAHRFRPYFKEAIVQHNLDATVFFLFADQGEVIAKAVGAGGLPLNEVLEVMFANADYVIEQRQAKSVEGLAARFVEIRNHKPSVWKAARYSSLALRLNEDVPQHADGLLEKYGPDDIAAFLYAAYEKEVAFAAEAVVKFGDLGIYILNQYAGSDAFRQALVRPGVGPRLIPYTATFGDQGIERLEEKREWLDKYFTADGTPKEEEWWTQIPGGGAANVARNWAKGNPNEWSELGWAALDVADAALLVASFGSSAAVTTSVKEGGAAVAKTVAKSEGKRQALLSGRAAARSAAKAAAEKESQTLLRRAMVKGLRWAAATGATAGRGWRLAAATVRVAERPVKGLLQAAKTVDRAWASVPPAIRRIVYRSLLAVGLYVTISQRTVPALDKIGAEVGKFVGQVAKNTSEALASGLSTALNELLGRTPGRLSVWLAWGLYALGLIALGGLTWLLLPKRKGGLRYA
jgi:hypothetical protein